MFSVLMTSLTEKNLECCNEKFDSDHCWGVKVNIILKHINLNPVIGKGKNHAKNATSKLPKGQ